MYNKSSFLVSSLKNRTTILFLIKLFFWFFVLTLWIKKMVLNDFAASLFTLVVLCAIIIYLINNFLLFLKFYIYLEKVRRSRVKFKKDECDVKIFQSPLKTTTMLRSGSISLYITPKEATCSYILLNDCFVLFCKIPYLGRLFQRYINPIIIRIDDHGDCLFKTAPNYSYLLSDLIFEGNSLILNINKNKEYSKIEITNFIEIYYMNKLK